MSGFTDVAGVSAEEVLAVRRASGTRARCACEAELRAVCAILFGVSALCVSFLTFPWLMSLFVVFLIVDGALVISFACLAAWQHERGAAPAPVLPAMANLLVAATVLLAPAMSLPALVSLLAVWAGMTGVLGMEAAWRGPGRRGRFVLLAVGAVSISWAVSLYLVQAARPMALAWWLGLYALSLGLMLLSLAPRLRAALK